MRTPGRFGSAVQGYNHRDTAVSYTHLEKKKQAKRLEKQKRKEERQAAGTSSFDDMIAYVDENGNFTNIPPEERKKETVKLEDIAIATPKKDVYKRQVYGSADPDTYPLQKKGHSMEFLREIAYLRPRTNTFGAVLRIRHAMAYAIHKYFNDRGFYYLHTPLITGRDAEGAGAMFQVTCLLYPSSKEYTHQ